MRTTAAAASLHHTNVWQVNDVGGHHHHHTTAIASTHTYSSSPVVLTDEGISNQLTTATATATASAATAHRIITMHDDGPTRPARN